MPKKVRPGQAWVSDARACRDTVRWNRKIRLADDPGSDELRVRHDPAVMGWGVVRPGTLESRVSEDETH